jgi:ketosteroid isomerase-like protein
MQNKTKIIRDIFAAYMSNDRKAVEEAPADDFRFTSPYDDEIEKATYFARCWRNSEWIERHEIEKIFVEGDEAFVTYNCVARGGKEFPEHRVLPLRRRQGQANRRVFRRRLAGRRRRQAERKLIGIVFMSLTLHFHPWRRKEFLA